MDIIPNRLYIVKSEMGILRQWVLCAAMVTWNLRQLSKNVCAEEFMAGKVTVFGIF